MDQSSSRSGVLSRKPLGAEGAADRWYGMVCFSFRSRYSIVLVLLCCPSDDGTRLAFSVSSRLVSSRLASSRLAQNCESECRTGVLEEGKVEDTGPDVNCYDGEKRGKEVGAVVVVVVAVAVAVAGWSK